MSSEQIERLKQKLQQAKETDNHYKVFGAGSHKYEMNGPISISKIIAFEQYYSVQLPECYKSFVLQIGNGGKSFLNSGSGPYFGIYPFGQNLDDLIYKNVENHLKKECALYPNITWTEWDKMTDPFYEEDITDEDYNRLNGTLYGGILPLGSQGCSFIHALVLNGPHKGRVVNLDRGELSPPKFSEDHTFLDWYERWLNEIISGKLITTSPSWFGYPKH
ncbi:SMI1/KNR4 family protein [Allomuricauda sp. F6463D]|uniref:SMI1/KNR4 family protein n=1 Tax=Allomuricauda sp. F6463D TaxID=2926409 RepID=UPI001FF3D605|nr:SMI1/KNR4 family protein [Muricauda sp. F6463D]MCK0161376.1 SMI1/KNR4 family protein [Muricauda sp. F6463D]